MLRMRKHCSKASSNDILTAAATNRMLPVRCLSCHRWGPSAEVTWHAVTAVAQVWPHRTSRSPRSLVARVHSGSDNAVHYFLQPNGPGSKQQNQALTVQYILQQLRQQMHTTSNTVQSNEVTVSGKGRHLGINIEWSMRWRADGSFREEITGKELGFQWGYDGHAGSSCWEMDSSGVSRSLECDDHEALLVGSWVRTGLWLQPRLTEQLDIKLLPPQEQKLQQPAVSNMKRGDAKNNTNMSSSSSAAGPSPQSASSQSSESNKDTNATRQGTPKQQNFSQTGQSSRTSSSESNSQDVAPQEPQPLVLTVRLKGGKLVNRVKVCPVMWVVQSLDQPLCGDTEVWEFGAWTKWKPHVLFPEHASHQAIAGGQHVYLTQTCTLSSPSHISHFQCPATPILPGDTSFTPGIPAELPIWKTVSGHLLVLPRINGRAGGYMVVDTGASGFVITPRAAVDLGLDAFGELFAASIAGKIPTQFVKAKTWSLGPLSISNPVMMTMTLDGLVRGVPPGKDVIGIVGYDIFRRAVIELPEMSFGPGATTVELAPKPAGILSTGSYQQAITPQPAMSPQAVGSWQGVSRQNTTRQRSPSPTMGLPNADQTSSNGSSSGNTRRSPPRRLGKAAVRGKSDPPAEPQQGGPMPFLRGLFSAASTGLVGNGWGNGKPPHPSNPTAAATSSSATSSSTAHSIQHESSNHDRQGSSVVCHSTAANVGMTGFSQTPSPASSPSVTPADGDANLGNQALKQDIAASGKGKDEKQAANGFKQWQSTLWRQYTMKLYKPDEYDPAEEGQWSWQPFRMIASLPHVEVQCLGADGTPIQAMLMLDSGACGADIMLHARAMQELDLHKLSRPSSQFVRGVGGGANDHGVQMEIVDLEWVQLAGIRFKQVKCMNAGVGGLDISLHSAGILCGDLLTRLPMVYDYTRKRIGFRLDKDRQ